MNNPAKSIYDEVRAIGEAGFDFVDLTLVARDATDVDTAKMLPVLDQYNLGLTGHTDPCLPRAYPIPTIRKACLDELARCARIFSVLGSIIMNIHPCYFCPPAMRGLLVKLNIEALNPIVEMVSSYGLTVAFENFKPPFDRIDSIKTLLREAAGLSVHLDFGHANM